MEQSVPNNPIKRHFWYIYEENKVFLHKYGKKKVPTTEAIRCRHNPLFSTKVLS